MRFYEEYNCGCLSKMDSKKALTGYCPQHGDNRKHIYRQDGLPADEATIQRARELRASITGRKVAQKKEQE